MITPLSEWSGPRLGCQRCGRYRSPRREISSSASPSPRPGGPAGFGLCDATGAQHPRDKGVGCDRTPGGWCNGATRARRAEAAPEGGHRLPRSGLRAFADAEDRGRVRHRSVGVEPQHDDGSGAPWRFPHPLRRSTGSSGSCSLAWSVADLLGWHGQWRRLRARGLSAANRGPSAVGPPGR
jgi:hypothetical protein